MDKILNFFDGIANFFGGIQSDKYAHLLVSLVATFVKNAAATWNVVGVSGIPAGWTVETASK